MIHVCVDECRWRTLIRSMISKLYSSGHTRVAFPYWHGGTDTDVLCSVFSVYGLTSFVSQLSWQRWAPLCNPGGIGLKREVSTLSIAAGREMT